MPHLASELYDSAVGQCCPLERDISSETSKVDSRSI